MILHFNRTKHIVTLEGGLFDEHQCVEHPRLKHLQQRGRESAPTTTSFLIDGVANYFESIDQALDALRANPRPGDIVAIPPTDPRP